MMVGLSPLIWMTGGVSVAFAAEDDGKLGELPAPD
jgi:hypothetical protein